jgi:dTDP-L-rhamnose 4-epimerase
MKERILITGGAGFIGSHLAIDLSNDGFPVRVLDNFSPQVHDDSSEPTDRLQAHDIEVIKGDVRSIEDLKRALRGIDIVYHFAAAVGVGQSMYQVKSYIDTNNLGTANLLQLLIDNPIKKLIVASSMSIYGEGLYKDKSGKIYSDVKRTLSQVHNHQWEPLAMDGSELEPIPTTESKRPDLASIYALSKFDQEKMCLMIGQAYKIPAVALRFFNVYGRGQSLSNPYTGVMAIFASRLLNNRPPLIFEDGYQKRDFVHVSDVVNACRLAQANSDADGKSFNIGSGHRYTIREIATLIASAMEKEDDFAEITEEYRVGDIRHCFADISLAKEVLGFQPSVELRAGLLDLTEWLSQQNAIDRTNLALEELSSRGLAV